MLFAVYSLREQTRQLKVGNALVITQHHRELWGYMLDHPDLQRVFDKTADIVAQPISERERMFVNMMFLHSSVCLKAAREKVIPPIEGIEADIRDILSYPLPKAVWKDVRPYHEKTFAAFVQQSFLGTP